MHRNFVMGLAIMAFAGVFMLTGSRVCAEPAAVTAEWRKLEPGLEFGEFAAPVPSPVGDSKISVLRFDPGTFSLQLLSQKHLRLPRPLTIDEWTREYKLAAAINGGMFEPDGGTVGYSRIEGEILNPQRKPNYGAYFAFDPKDPAAGLPAAAILDGECDDVSKLETQYRQVLQSMRMISCKGANLWPKSPRIWSTAALAVDNGGRVLFIMARSPWDVRDFIDILQKLPLGITRAMYLEGGPEASLALAAGGIDKTLVGSFETGFNENDGNTRAWTLPNVIGVRRIVADD